MLVRYRNVVNGNLQRQRIFASNMEQVSLMADILNPDYDADQNNRKFDLLSNIH